MHRERWTYLGTVVPVVLSWIQIEVLYGYELGHGLYMQQSCENAIISRGYFDEEVYTRTWYSKLKARFSAPPKRQQIDWCCRQ